MPNTTVQIECASEKCMNVHKNQKKDHPQPLQTILRRIGPFVFILARSSARTHTPLQKLLRFEQNARFFEHPGEFLKNLFLLKKEGEP